jgi:ABC-2 type transport system permease protein
MAAALNEPGCSVMHAFLHSAKRECLHLLQDRWDLALVTWMPLLALALLAWFFSAGVLRKLPIVVVDRDHSTLSRQLIRMLDENSGLRVAYQRDALIQAWPLMRAGNSYAVVFVGENTSRDTLVRNGGTIMSWYNASYLTAGQAAAREISSTVQAFGQRVAIEQTAAIRGPAKVRSAPISVQVSVLGNAARSYEHFLLSLLFPALLHLAATLAMGSAFGRELRNGTVAAWMEACGWRVLPAIAGKAAPYLLLFLLYAVLGLGWLVSSRGGGVQGNVALLVLGYALMFLAYAAIALLLVGATRNMGTALSLVSMYAGTSLAFSGGTFPVIDANTFVQVWNAVLPYTYFLHLQSQQLDAHASLADAANPLAILVLFILIAGGVGWWLYARAARDPAAWGLR